MKSNTKPFAGLFLFLQAFSLFCVISLAGCSRNSGDASFQEKLELIDACLENEQNRDALKLLKKAEKSASSVTNRLSVVKRYIQTGCTDRAEAYLKSSLKKLKDSRELIAVYCNILLRSGKLEEASSYITKLDGTKWSSIYTEYLLRRIQESSMYQEQSCIELYKAAAAVNNEDVWNRNAAVLLMKEGRTAEAAALSKQDTTDKNLYFWALVNYDAGDFASCIEFCDIDTDSALPADKAASVFLCSDAWLQSGDADDANRYWKNAIASVPENEIPAGIYKNAARYALLHEDYTTAGSLLLTLVNVYPDYIPGLVDYARFSKKLSLKKADDEKSRQFRAEGITTLAMDLRDKLAMIPMSDVLYRMNASLEREFNPVLLMEYTKLKWEEDNSPVIKRRQDLWALMEKYRNDSSYEPYICDFTICWLIRNYYEDEAKVLYDTYKAELASIPDEQLLPRFYMLEAWFELGNKNYEKAFQLYNSCYKAMGKKTDSGCVMNLASLYNAKGNSGRALELYSSLDSLVTDTILASEIQCRIGYIQYARQEKNNALQSLSYSVKLNPDNNRAWMLLKQL